MPADPVALLKEAVAAILCRDIDDPVVKTVALAFLNSAEKAETVLRETGYGNANMFFQKGEYEGTAVGLTYPQHKQPVTNPRPHFPQNKRG